MSRNTKLIAIAALLIAGAAAGFFGARTYERSQCATRAELAAGRAEARLNALRTSAENSAVALGKHEGEAILRSFVAGLAPVVLAGRDSAVDVAGASLLRLSGVRGVTVLRANGETLYASDAKLTVSDAGSEQTRWALKATDFMTRDSLQPGVTEMSLPITDRGTVLAIVWLAYDTSRARDQLGQDFLRPASAAESRPR